MCTKTILGSVAIVLTLSLSGCGGNLRPAGWDWTKIAKDSKENPHNLTLKFLTAQKELIQKMDQKTTDRLLAITRDGREAVDSNVGTYIGQMEDLKTFKTFINAILETYHDKQPKDKHAVQKWSEFHSGSNWSIAKVFNGIPKSVRIRVARNLVGEVDGKELKFPSLMDKEMFLGLEKKFHAVFEKMIKTFGGKVYIYDKTHEKCKAASPIYVCISVKKVPSGKKDTNGKEVMEFEDKEQMAKIDKEFGGAQFWHFNDFNAKGEEALQRAGISTAFPAGRGSWAWKDPSSKGMMVVYYNEEDHLRPFYVKETLNYADVSDGFKKMYTELEKNLNTAGLKFAQEEGYGFVNSCPSNFGTALRTSVKGKFPALAKKYGNDKEKMNEKSGDFAKLGLQVRGPRGETSDIGPDGEMEFSPMKRMYITEYQIIDNFVKGLNKVVQLEDAAAKAQKAA